jgi:hypothetical protein
MQTATSHPQTTASTGIRKIAHKVLEEIITEELLEKIARTRLIGADDQLINLCLKKAEWPFSLEEIIAQLATDDFRQIYIHLDPKVQAQIETLISPPSLLPAARKPRVESEIWQARHEIHKLKTESINLGKTRTKRTWKEVTAALHEQDILPEKTQEQIYWTLKDKRESPNLSAEDKTLLDQIFARNERGKIKQQIEQMADAIEMARSRLSWEETQATLQDFFGWSGTMKQLMGAYARIRIERLNKIKPASEPAKTETQPKVSQPPLTTAAGEAKPVAATPQSKTIKPAKRERKKVAA